MQETGFSSTSTLHAPKLDLRTRSLRERAVLRRSFTVPSLRVCSARVVRFFGFIYLFFECPKEPQTNSRSYLLTYLLACSAKFMSHCRSAQDYYPRKL